MSPTECTVDADFGIVFDIKTTSLEDLYPEKTFLKYISDETTLSTRPENTTDDLITKNTKKDSDDLTRESQFLTDFGHFHEIPKDANVPGLEFLSDDKLIMPLKTTSCNFADIGNGPALALAPKSNCDLPNKKIRFPIQDVVSPDIVSSTTNPRNGGGVGVGSKGNVNKQVKFRAYQAENWTEKFEQLLRFREEHGHSLVPNFHPENQALAQWAKRQRYQYKLKQAGKRSTITDERVRALDEVGFVWGSHEAVWSERLEELKMFREQHHHCNVPCRYKPNQQLALWVKRQRRQWKKKMDRLPNSLTDERQALLEEIGFVWDMRKGK